MTASTATTTATILTALYCAQCATSKALVETTGLAKGTVNRVLRALDTRGFVFCVDDYEGRNRKPGGKYANALWMMNCEVAESITVEEATKALSRDGHGGTILCDMGLGN